MLVTLAGVDILFMLVELHVGQWGILDCDSSPNFQFGFLFLHSSKLNTYPHIAQVSSIPFKTCDFCLHNGHSQSFTFTSDFFIVLVIGYPQCIHILL